MGRVLVGLELLGMDAVEALPWGLKGLAA
jgi:hypothetical protein